MPFDRRAFLLGAGAAVSATAIPANAVAAVHNATSFPKNFLWGAATAGHQIEGSNVNSDSWLLENCKPTIFREPSLDAANSFELWATDLDLVKSLGLNSYRFSLEWARIEPVEGMFSVAMLDHYRGIIEGCRHRGLVPVVTFNHFTTPRWFAAQGGWTNPKSPALFARYCERAARHLGALIGYATTLNEPNVCAAAGGDDPGIRQTAAPFQRDDGGRCQGFRIRSFRRGQYRPARCRIGDASKHDRGAQGRPGGDQVRSALASRRGKSGDRR